MKRRSPFITCNKQEIHLKKRAEEMNRFKNRLERDGRTHTRRSLSRISISLMTLALVGFSALTAVADARPFHLVEHGSAKITPLPNNAGLQLSAEGTGNATHLGRFTL